MTDAIRDDLLERLRALAARENRTVDQVVEDLLAAYATHQPPSADTEDREASYEAARCQTLPPLIERARSYWRSVGDQERLALSDDDLMAQFWLIDHEGIPRLKSEIGQVEFPADSSVRLAAAARAMPSFGGPSDVSERSRAILETEWGDYLLARLNRPAVDDAADSGG